MRRVAFVFAVLAVSASVTGCGGGSGAPGTSTAEAKKFAASYMESLGPVSPDKPAAETALEEAKLSGNEQNLGAAAAKAFLETWPHVTYPTKYAFDQRMPELLEKLPARARAVARAAMLAYLPTIERDEHEKEASGGQ